MPLGTKVSLGPGDIMLDGDPAPPMKEAQQPALFGPCLLWPNGRPSQLLLSTCKLFAHCIKLFGFQSTRMPVNVRIYVCKY